MLFHPLSYLVQFDCYSQGVIDVLEKSRLISQSHTASTIEAEAAFNSLALQGSETGTGQESDQGN